MLLRPKVTYLNLYCLENLKCGKLLCFLREVLRFLCCLDFICSYALVFCDDTMFYQYSLRNFRYFQTAYTLWVSEAYFQHYFLVPVCGLVTSLLLFGQDSSVGIATRYGLDGPRIESRWGRDFPRLSRPALGLSEPLMQWVPGLSRGKVAEAWHRPPTPIQSRG